jgi:hypothetical protein
MAAHVPGHGGGEPVPDPCLMEVDQLEPWQ